MRRANRGRDLVAAGEVEQPSSMREPLEAGIRDLGGALPRVDRGGLQPASEPSGGALPADGADGTPALSIMDA